MRLLRRQPMEAQRRQQADRSVWNSFADFRQGMVLSHLRICQRIETSARLLENSLSDKIPERCPPNTVRFKVASPKNARRLERGLEYGAADINHFNTSVYMHSIRRFAILNIDCF